MKKFLGLLVMMLMVASNCFAMTFSHIVKIGEIGFPVQAPYHGFIVEGATKNEGVTYNENRERNGKPLTTYINGIACFEEFYCKYNFKAKNFSESISFGGKDNFILTQDGSYRKIFSVGNDAGLKLYAIYYSYRVTDLKILGTQKNGKWVIYIDSKKIDDKYFDGNNGYNGGYIGRVLYDVPTCAGDTLIVTYRRFNRAGISEPEGEFRFKWNEAAQWFGVEQVIY